MRLFKRKPQMTEEEKDALELERIREKAARAAAENPISEPAFQITDDPALDIEVEEFSVEDLPSAELEHYLAMQQAQSTYESKAKEEEFVIPDNIRL